MAGESFANSLTVEVSGNRLPVTVAELLTSAYVDNSSRLPDLFVLRFRDPDHQVLQKGGFAIGAPLRMYAKAADDTQRQLLLSGEITAVELDLDSTGAFTVVRGLDHSHRLFRGRRVEGYRQMTASDIAVAVARRAGLKPGTVDATSEVHPYLTQAGVTDWDFLWQLALRAGREVAVVDGKFEFRKPVVSAGAPSASTPVRSSPFVLERGRNLLRCHAMVTSADQVRQVEVRGWDVAAKRSVVGREPAGSTDRLSLGRTPQQVAEPFGEAVRLATDVPYGTQAEADRAAKALAADVASSFAELEAVAMGIPTLRAGTAVALNNVGAPFEGKYTVTATRHVFDPEFGYQTWITVGGRSDRSLYGLSSGSGTGAASRTRISGLVSATVTDVRDPQTQGRVKLAFPWLSDEYVSDWARTVQFGGQGGGGVFSPEVGDEVLVGFEQGLIDYPYAIGGLYNGSDHPSKHDCDLVDSTDGSVSRRSLVSRSGNRIELLDSSSGPKGVRLSTGDGKLTVHLDGKQTSVVVHSDGTVAIDAKQKVTVTADQGISLDAGSGKLELTGQAVQVTGKSGVQLDGGSGALTLQTQGQLDVKGATVGVSGSLSTEIKGGAKCAITAALITLN